MRDRPLIDRVQTRNVRTRRWLAEYPRFVPVAIFLLVAAITAFTVITIERGAVLREKAALNRTATALAAAVERRGATSATYLRAGAALFGTQTTVDPQIFRRFVAELRLDTDYRGADGIGWAPAIEAADVPAIEEQLRQGKVGVARVFPSLSVRPREILAPVLDIQPDTLRNRGAIGFDMYSDAVRRQAMDEAAQSAQPTASGRVILVQEGTAEERPGFLVYMPVYDNVDGERMLRGFIYSPFNARQFLDSAAELVDYGEMGVRLYDGPVNDAALLAQLPGWGGASEKVTRELRLANRTMHIVVESAHKPVLTTMSIIALFFGLAVASLLMLVARLLMLQAVEDQRSIEWFEEQNSIRVSLTRELNHRVKNTLANVLSLVSLTRRRAHDIDDFADGLDGRIRALSATHDLLTSSEWGTTPIRSVVAAELGPYSLDADHEITNEGPPVELAPNDALSLGLALHELATNAAKYGSLSVPGGKVSVVWDITNDGLARINWVESDGPPVTPPRERGFGTDLIEKIVAHELRHPVDLVFAPEGVRCTLLVPVRERGEFEIRAKSNARIPG